MPEDNIFPLKTSPIDRQRPLERRLQERHTSKRLTVTFLGADHEAINWSLGGFLILDQHPERAVGSVAEGFLTIGGRQGRFPIRVELVRRSTGTGEAAFRFVDLSPLLASALSSIID